MKVRYVNTVTLTLNERDHAYLLRFFEHVNNGLEGIRDYGTLEEYIGRALITGRTVGGKLQKHGAKPNKVTY